MDRLKAYLFALLGTCDCALDGSYPRFPVRLTVSAQHAAPHCGVNAEILWVLVGIRHGHLHVRSNLINDLNLSLFLRPHLCFGCNEVNIL